MKGRIVITTMIFLSVWFAAERVYPACTGTIFSDVNATTVGPDFCDFIERLAGLGITTGFPDGTFRPGNNVTRLGMASFMVRTVDKLTAKTPQQIALLKWYDANQAASFTLGVAGGLIPRGVAFDGADIWVTTLSPLVTKLRASDGAVLGTFNNGALFPSGIAFDGANIWVANNGSNNVTKLRASDGAMLGTFIVGNGPDGVAFDGANIWVANRDGTVSKL